MKDLEYWSSLEGCTTKCPAVMCSVFLRNLEGRVGTSNKQVETKKVLSEGSKYFMKRVLVVFSCCMPK